MRVAGLALLAALALPARGEPVVLSARLAGVLMVEVSLSAEGWLAPTRVMLYRSTSWLDENPDTLALPVTVLEFTRADSGGSRYAIADTMVAHNARYFYRARLERPDGTVLWSTPDSVETPDAGLGTIAGSSLLIDKRNYFLAVRDGGVTRKRYPIALGRQPRRRKLHQDNASTPEGFYHIAAEQPAARFHKAFDLDYPNLVDGTRYRYCRDHGLITKRDGDVPGIGGEVQVHGEGIERNWTFGCIALRNADMDELFGHRRVGRGMPVHIVGSELTRADIQSIMDYRPGAEMKGYQRKLTALGFYDGKIDGEVGRGMRAALAAFQHTRGLAITGQLDCRTVEELKRD